MSGVLRWEDPPPHRNRGRTTANFTRDTAPKWPAVAAELREQPGRWGVIRERVGIGSAGPLVRSVTGGLGTAWRPAGYYEAASRKRDDGEGLDVYARYVGEAGSEATNPNDLSGVAGSSTENGDAGVR